MPFGHAGTRPISVTQLYMALHGDGVHTRSAALVQMGSGLSVGSKGPTNLYLKGSAPARAPVAVARDFVKQSGVKAALRVSRSYVADFWARINGLRLSTATESLPFGLPTPCGRAGASTYMQLQASVATAVCCCACLLHVL
jgi:hypothetical protein